VQRPGVVVDVERRRAADQRVGLRQPGDLGRPILRKGDRRSPGNAGPVEERHVVGRGLEAPQAVIARPHVEPACALQLGIRARHVALLGLFGRQLHVDIRVLGEAARRGEKQAAVLGHLGEQRLDGLQAERCCSADQLYVIVGGVDVAAARERVAHRAHRHLAHRAARQCECDRNRQQPQQTGPHGSSLSVVLGHAFARRVPGRGSVDLQRFSAFAA